MLREVEEGRDSMSSGDVWYAVESDGGVGSVGMEVTSCSCMPESLGLSLWGVPSAVRGVSGGAGELESAVGGS